jgi:hypothetical protein
MLFTQNAHGDSHASLGVHMGKSQKRVAKNQCEPQNLVGFSATDTQHIVAKNQESRKISRDIENAGAELHRTAQNCAQPGAGMRVPN